MNKIFKNLGKAPSGLPPSQIHTPNLYFQSLDESKSKGMYEKSVAALSPTTYQQSNKINFQFAKWYAFLYHGISAGLGLATVGMLAFIFSGAGAGSKYPSWLLYGMFTLTFIILCALLIGIETFKGSLAKGIFKHLAVGAKVGIPAVIGLVLVMLFSILVSAVGGAVLSYEMNDKSEQISQNYSVQADSLRKLHDDNLQAVNASVEAYKANLNKGNYWAKYATREKLDKAIQTRNDLLKTTTNQQLTIQSAKDKDINLNSSEGKNFALISAIIVFVLEILSILAYWFQYVYHANCEKEAVNFQILSPTVEVVSNNTSNPKSELSEIRDLLQNILSGNNNLQLAGNTVNPSSQKVGFSFGSNPQVNNAQVNNLSVSNAQVNNVQVRQVHIGDTIQCEFCGNDFTKKTLLHRFCSKSCKLSWHKENNGFDLKLHNKKKGGKN